MFSQSEINRRTMQAICQYRLQSLSGSWRGKFQKRATRRKTSRTWSLCGILQRQASGKVHRIIRGWKSSRPIARTRCPANTPAELYRQVQGRLIPNWPRLEHFIRPDNRCGKHGNQDNQYPQPDSIDGCGNQIFAIRNHGVTR